MSDQSASLNNNSNGLAQVISSGFGAAATIFTADATAKAAKNATKKALNPTTLLIVGGVAIAGVFILVMALKKK